MPVDLPAAPLDDLAVRWLDGDEHARELLFADLHVRLTAIAKRRVRPGQAEDLVQEVLAIVLRKAITSRRTTDVLPWSLTILRNVIGNHYQAVRREGARMATTADIMDTVADPAPGPGEGDNLEVALEKALVQLAERYPRCGRVFEAILSSLEEGGGTQEVSTRALAAARRTDPGLAAGAWYTALHRCRAHLRALMGPEVDHE